MILRQNKEEPFHHTIGHWQTYGYSFFRSETAFVFGVFSEYDTGSTENLSTFTDKINPSRARSDIIFRRSKYIAYSVQNCYRVWQITIAYVMILSVFSFWEMYILKIFMHHVVVYPCYLLSIPFKVADGFICTFPSAETYPKFISRSLEISIYATKSERIVNFKKKVNLNCLCYS